VYIYKRKIAGSAQMCPKIILIFNPYKTKVIFFKKTGSNLPFLAQEAQMKKKMFVFAILIVRSCPRLLGEHVQKVSKTLTTQIARS
jgi:hypothetical protein